MFFSNYYCFQLLFHFVVFFSNLLILQIGDVYGDPHVRVKSKGQDAICFDIIDIDETIFDFLSDPKTGLEVNGQIFAVGHRTRLEKIFVRSPIGVEVEVTPHEVRVGFNNNILQSFDFDAENVDFGKDDLHLEVLR